MACKHSHPEGYVWVGETKPPSYECSFCEMERLSAEVNRLESVLKRIDEEITPVNFAVRGASLMQSIKAMVREALGAEVVR